ncbi:oligopeptide/dipeptide ABC transporter ATP-binding protein, partial [Paeniglutamicibacter kerguelensis]
IAHDLQIVRHISDRVATMYLGRVVELGTYADVYDRTGQPYTRALMSAAPELRRNDGTDRERIVLQGDPPSPIDPPAGCRFHTRCPMAQAICATKEPELVQISDTHVARCHFATNTPTN